MKIEKEFKKNGRFVRKPKGFEIAALIRESTNDDVAALTVGSDKPIEKCSRFFIHHFSALDEKQRVELSVALI